MIIITGGFTATPETLAALMAGALEHVHRSRGEDGCISHDLLADAEDPLRFFFFERWRDMAAVRAHFRVPASGGFVALLRDQASAVEELTIYQADALPFP